MKGFSTLPDGRVGFAPYGFVGPTYALSPQDAASMKKAIVLLTLGGLAVALTVQFAYPAAFMPVIFVYIGIYLVIASRMMRGKEKLSQK